MAFHPTKANYCIVRIALVSAKTSIQCEDYSQLPTSTHILWCMRGNHSPYKQGAVMYICLSKGHRTT